MRIDEAVAATYAGMGQELSDIALAVIVRDLRAYPLPGVLVALSRCRKELRRMTLADILQRIPGGHPGPEEAWALVARGLADEGPTLVWTDQIREAFGVALGLSDDPVAARMAFKECYTRLVAEAVERGGAPVWSASLGWDVNGRASPLIDAVAKGRLPGHHALGLLPPAEDVSERVLEIAGKAVKQIGGAKP